MRLSRVLHIIEANAGGSPLFLDTVLVRRAVDAHRRAGNARNPAVEQPAERQHLWGGTVLDHIRGRVFTQRVGVCNDELRVELSGQECLLVLLDLAVQGVVDAQ
eukprot:4520833-Pyramimonas_sp.AAC.1